VSRFRILSRSKQSISIASYLTRCICSFSSTIIDGHRVARDESRSVARFPVIRSRPKTFYRWYMNTALLRTTYLSTCGFPVSRSNYHTSSGRRPPQFTREQSRSMNRMLLIRSKPKPRWRMNTTIMASILRHGPTFFSSSVFSSGSYRIDKIKCVFSSTTKTTHIYGITYSRSYKSSFCKKKIHDFSLSGSRTREKSAG
jgi:hypothetical protein